MIRPFQPGDVEVLKDLTALCFEGVSIDRNIEERIGEVNGHDWRWRKLRHIDQDVAGDHADHVFVFEVEGRVRGYITGRIDDESGIGWIPNLAVHPDCQGQGIGKQLMRHQLDHFRALGMKGAKIETLAQNEVGSSFYPQAGFEEVARQIHYVQRLSEEEGGS
ncbi:MAG: GNAT family N-acetyltransferase [Verrucomicrobiota bacterium]